jgi:ankyrin repeat protein
MPEKSLPALIIEAINAEDAGAIRQLLRAHPEQVDAHTFMAGQTWLGYAAQKGKLEAVRSLLAAGSDINKGDRHEGASPLCGAAASNHPSVAAHLVAAGAALSVDASVRNPLFAAIIGRSPDCVRLILDAGIDAAVRYNTRTMADMDAVAFAMMRGEQECAELIALRNTKGDEPAARRAIAEADAVAMRNAR